MHPVMNNTKWDELRLAMFELGENSPKWRTLDAENGHLSEWDGEWFHHFHAGGYKFIKWVEIAIENPLQEQAVLAQLVKVHVPGTRVEGGFRIYGYMDAGVEMHYLG
ncbi:DUF6678 family protein [Duganella sp. Root1480D1]|uniref:DUF6678 family protein n=1 Tax=Duganella sp. Root1480D1 TaxID=1736471 RepID=UPI00070F7909|nr:DUF6678 family protein [Duganella sp. Root1480D1]KQZ35135.1 hypothetical protein ASD58_28390 [Duganella sp. Root1480D1]